MFCCFLWCCKQKVSVVFMWILSTLLFFAGGMTIYITVCLFENKPLFGGAGTFAL